MEFTKPTEQINEELREGYKGLTWSYPTKITGRCTHVSKTDKVPGSRLIGGAPKFWASDDADKNSIIYIPELAISGMRTDIIKALTAAGYTKEDAKEFVADGLSRSNYETTHAERFSKAKNMTKGKKDIFEEVRVKLLECSKHIEDGDRMVFLDSKHQQVGKVNNQKKVVEKKTPEETMIARYEALDADTVLDFTKLVKETWKGVVSKKIKEENRRPYYHAVGYPIISKDKENFKTALRTLEPENCKDLYRKASANFKEYEAYLKKKEKDEKKKKEKKEKEKVEKEKSEEKSKEKSKSFDDTDENELLDNNDASDGDDDPLDDEDTEEREERKREEEREARRREKRRRERRREEKAKRR